MFPYNFKNKRKMSGSSLFELFAGVGLFLSTVCVAEDLDFERALVFLQQGKSQEANVILENIPQSHPKFLSALLELQKLNYKNEDWNRFFAYAVFYRQNYINHPVVSQDQFKVRLLSLEALALGKYCLWKEADAVIYKGLEIAKKSSRSDIQELENTKMLLNALRVYPGAQKSARNAEIPSSIFQEIHYWPISHKRAMNVAHPKYMRLQLESRCRL